MYSNMAKGTSRTETTSNSKKIKPVALAIVGLCKSEGIKQVGRQAGRQSVENYFISKFCRQLFWA